MRRLLAEILQGKMQKDIAAGAGIRPNTIGDYLNGHQGMTVRSYERILNFILKE